MRDPSTIEAVFFDYGGTLDADGVAWKDRFFAFYAAAGLDVARPRFDRAFYDADDSLLAERVWEVSLSEIVHEQVGRVLTGLQAYSRDLHERVARAFYEDSRRQIARNEPLLAQLQRSYRLGIISNNYGNLAAICDETGLAPYFDALIDSSQIGCTKPDPRIFRAGLEALDVAPERALDGRRFAASRHGWGTGARDASRLAGLTAGRSERGVLPGRCRDR